MKYIIQNSVEPFIKSISPSLRKEIIKKIKEMQKIAKEKASNKVYGPANNNLKQQHNKNEIKFYKPKSEIKPSKKNQTQQNLNQNLPEESIAHFDWKKYARKNPMTKKEEIQEKIDSQIQSENLQGLYNQANQLNN